MWLGAMAVTVATCCVLLLAMSHKDVSCSHANPIPPLPQTLALVQDLSCIAMNELYNATIYTQLCRGTGVGLLTV